jgi:outer membrane protein
MRNFASLLFALVLCGLFARTAHADDIKLGYVDLQRAISETAEGQAAKKKLQGIFKQKQKELDEKQEDLKKRKANFDKQKTILKPEAMQQQAKELEQSFVDLQQTYLRLQKDLSEKEQQMTAPIFGKMRNVIAKIAERDAFTMIFERSASETVLWAKPSLDLTNEVIRRYNAGEGGTGKGGK